MVFRLPATLLAFACSVGFACLVLSPLGLAQDDYFAQAREREKVCGGGAASAVTVDHDGGVTVQKVTLSGKWGHQEATFYLPEKEIADGAVLFSHSAIHADSGASVDLHPFALTLAHAGAAVMLPERTMNWPAADATMNREGAEVVCAEHWLVDHTKVFNDGEATVKPVNGRDIVVRESYAYVGPNLCDPTFAPSCELTDPFHFDDCGYTRYCRTSVVYVCIGEYQPRVTDHVLSSGWLREAQFIQKLLGLAPIPSPAAVQAHN